MHLQELPDESDETPVYGGHGTRSDGSQPTGPVEYFSHLVIGVTDLDRSEAWYRDVIGLDVLGRGLLAEERPHSVLQMNTGQLLVLTQVEKVEPSRGGVHHGFMLTPNQYRRAYERLTKLGHRIEDSREQFRAHGEYSIDIDDPDGHRYQIQCHGPEAERIMPGAGNVDCGVASKYRVGDVRAFKAGNFHLVRLKEGFLAVSKWCTHMNGIVIYQKVHWQFWCPFHGATYDRRGMPDPFLGNRAGGPLRLHPITFSPEGNVLVNTDEVICRTDYEMTQAVQPPDVAFATAPVLG
jgi:lactoylglutathione lyase